MKIVVLESLGISDNELNSISQPLTDSDHELVVYDDGKLDAETIKTRIKDADIIPESVKSVPTLSLSPPVSIF